MSVQVPPPNIIARYRPWLRDFVIRALRAAHRYGVMTGDAGVELTSWWRSVEDNESHDGHPRSFHLLGAAVDLVAEDPAAVVAASRAEGLEAIDFGTHVHVELPGPSPWRG